MVDLGHLRQLMPKPVQTPGQVVASQPLPLTSVYLAQSMEALRHLRQPMHKPVPTPGQLVPNQAGPLPPSAAVHLTVISLWPTPMEMVVRDRFAGQQARFAPPPAPVSYGGQFAYGGDAGSYGMFAHPGYPIPPPSYDAGLGFGAGFGGLGLGLNVGAGLGGFGVGLSL